MTNRRNSYAFWLGFLIAVIIVAAISIYFYQGNKDKKLKDIKSDLEKFFKTKIKNCPKVNPPKKSTPKITKFRTVPKKFISKR